MLDIGCGLGGASIALALNHGAAHVTGVDIEAGGARARGDPGGGVRALGTGHAARGGAGTLCLVDDGRFDIVYASAVTCHVEDLLPFFTEMRRVLRPGGHFTGGEWFIGPNTAAYSQWDDMLRAKGLNFYFVSWERFRGALEKAGFETPEFRDRSEAVSALCTRILEQVRGELRPSLESSLGRAGYEAFESWAASRKMAVAEGGAHYRHFLAHNPDPESA